MVRILQEHGTERVLVNSAADWGVSDPLRTRATGETMLAAAFNEDDVDRVLWRNAVDYYGRSGRLRPEHLGSLARSLIGVRLDTCHLAVGFEEPQGALARLSAAGPPAVKVQASCALHADDPKGSAPRACGPERGDRGRTPLGPRLPAHHRTRRGDLVSTVPDTSDRGGRTPVVVSCTVGAIPWLLAHMPNLRAIDEVGFSAPGHRSAYLCRWYAMGAGVDTVLTPRPVYRYDGRKDPD